MNNDVALNQGGIITILEISSLALTVFLQSQVLKCSGLFWGVFPHKLAMFKALGGVGRELCSADRIVC